jgi:hypothetical protein
VEVTDGRRIRRRRLWQSAAVALLVIGSTQSLPWFTILGAIAFGALVRRPAAVLIALVPFLIALPRATGDGDPPDWVAGLFFETPMLMLVVGISVLAGRLLVQATRA